MKPHVVLFFCFALYLIHPITVSGAEPYMQFGDTGIIYDAEYSPDGTMIAVGTSTGFQILDAVSYEIIHQEFTEKKVRIVKWFPDNKRLFIVMDSFPEKVLFNPTRTLMNISNKHYVFDVETLNIIYQFDHPILWHSLTSSPLKNQLTHKNSIGFSSNSSLVSVISDYNNLNIINLVSSEIVKSYEFENTINSTGISDDGNILWIGGVENELRIYDTNSFDLIDIKTITTDTPYSATIYYYSPEREFTIASSFRLDNPRVPFFFISSIFINYLNESGHRYTLARGFLRRNTVAVSKYHVFQEMLNGSILMLAIKNFIPTVNEDIVLNEYIYENQRNINKTIKQNYLATFFPKPFSPSGENMLSNNFIFATSDLFSQGAISNQPLTRILPKTPQPTVFDFHPNMPNTLLTYGTNQNTTEQGKLTLWDVPSRTEISSVTDVVMYENGTFSPDGSLFITVDQPFDGDLTKINVWESLLPLPDLFINVYDTDTWSLKSKFKYYEDNANLSSDVSFITCSPNNDYCFIGLGANVRSLNNGEKISPITYRLNGGGGDISPDGVEYVIPTLGTSFGWDYNFINANSGEIQTIASDFTHVNFIRYIDNGNKILMSNVLGIAAVFDRNLETEYIRFGDRTTGNEVYSLSPNEKYLFMDHEIWDVETGELVNTFGEEYGELEIIKISTNNKWVATRHEDKILRVWDLEKLVQQETAVDPFVQY